jgi:hypothetical protein
MKRRAVCRLCVLMAHGPVLTYALGSLLQLNGAITVFSTNNFATAAGLASSASGFAALCTSFGSTHTTRIIEPEGEGMEREGKG